MGKRKFTKMHEDPKGYECCKRNCKWQGQDKGKIHKKISKVHYELICPKCGNNEFYGLIDNPTN